MTARLAERVYRAAARAGLLRTCVWRAADGRVVRRTKVGFRAPDELLLDGLAASTEFVITYPGRRLPGLCAGDRVDIDGLPYRVREVRAVADGTERQARLMRL